VGAQRGVEIHKAEKGKMLDEGRSLEVICKQYQSGCYGLRVFLEEREKNER
jgi:hypothetical protein